MSDNSKPQNSSMPPPPPVTGSNPPDKPEKKDTGNFTPPPPGPVTPPPAEKPAEPPVEEKPEAEKIIADKQKAEKIISDLKGGGGDSSDNSIKPAKKGKSILKVGLGLLVLLVIGAGVLVATGLVQIPGIGETRRQAVEFDGEGIDKTIKVTDDDFNWCL